MKKNILITGATAGFGEAIARTFANENWNLIITGRRETRLMALKKELESKHNISVTTLCFDVRDENAVNQSISKLKNIKLNALINNAGLAVGRGAVQGGLTEDWNRMIDTNIKGLLYVTKACVPLMANGGNSNIVNVGSIAGKEAYAGGNVYCATKHAVDALSKSMRIDLLELGIKVSQVCPGAADTEFSLVRFKGDAEQAKGVYDNFSPLLANDIAEAVYFIVSRPPHVCINDMVIMPGAQANTSHLLKGDVWPN